VFASQGRWLNSHRERLEILKSWKQSAGRIAAAAESLLKGCEVYAFGSSVSGGVTAASDIDILIAAESLPKTLMGRAKIKEEMERLAKLPPHHPIQIHLVTKDEAKHSSIYSQTIRESLKIKINV